MATELRSAPETKSAAPDVHPAQPPSEAAYVTFIGGAEAGNVGSTSWGTDATGRVEFPLKEPQLIDPAQAKTHTQAQYLRHIIGKARGNRFYRVEGVKDGDKGKPAAEVKEAAPAPRTQPNPVRGKSRRASDDQDHV